LSDLQSSAVPVLGFYGLSIIVDYNGLPTIAVLVIRTAQGIQSVDKLVHGDERADNNQDAKDIPQQNITACCIARNPFSPGIVGNSLTGTIEPNKLIDTKGQYAQ
jgi:hypothetical protein